MSMIIVYSVGMIIKLHKIKKWNIVNGIMQYQRTDYREWAYIPVYQCIFIGDEELYKKWKEGANNFELYDNQKK